MGKSTSCLRLISCSGRGSNESNEAAPVDQTKNPKRKKGWRFNKRSSTGRAVTNSVIAKTPSLEHKENVQTGASDSIVSDKDSALKWDEKSQPPPQVASDFSVLDAVEVSVTEKQPATAAVNSYVPNDVSVPETDKQSEAATSYVPNDVSVPETEKQSEATTSYVPNDVSVPETEKQSEAVNLSVTDGLTDSKTGEYEAVLAVHETDVVIMQSAVRGFLVRKELKSIIKLQAVVRGHLVRCHAIGALRCIQAITKMQVLVRARYALSRKDGTPKSRPEVTYTSMTDLLKSSFARQLLESSLKAKPINIKCDPLSRDSSWVWLERWMSLASPGALDDLNTGTEKVQEVKNIELEQEEKTIDKKEEKKIDYLFKEENEIFLDAKDFANPSLISDSKIDFTEDTNPANSSELNLTNSSVDSHSVSMLDTQILDITDKVETVESVAEKYPVHAREISQHDIDFMCEKSVQNESALELKTEVEAEELQQIQTEKENILVTEPELVSAPLSAISSGSVSQDAEFEEPILATHLAVMCNDSVPAKDEAEDSAKDYISALQNAETEEVVPHSSEIDLSVETPASSDDDIVINHKEPSQPEISGIQVGESECGTELSITSTLDSPDRMEIEPTVELENVNLAGSETHEAKFNTFGDELGAEPESVELGKSAENAAADKIGEDEKKLETNVLTLQMSEATEEIESKTNASGLPTEPEETETSHQVSEMSQVTFSESQGTPSSQVSVSSKSKINKKSESIKKRTILSAVRKSPLTDSDDKNSSEKLPKEQKSVKKRTSFSSPNPEVSDQEHRRDSSTSSSLPSYMQATQSARAKASTGISPRSSPEVADNDVFLRKRHSISGTKDKQNSPRLQRTTSQAQSGTKSNGTSPLERKWQR